MSLFVAELAFREDDLLTASKLGILIGSFGAGIVGYFALRIQLKRKTKQTD